MTFAPLKSILTVVWRFCWKTFRTGADVQMIIEDAEHYFLEDSRAYHCKLPTV